MTPSESPLAASLRAAIEASGLTSAELARLAGVDAGVVSRFRSGRRDLYLATADRLAAFLGLRVAEAPRPRGRPPKSRPGPARPVRAVARGEDDAAGDG